MILLGLGANLDHPRYGTPKDTLEAALAAIEAGGVAVVARSPWYRSAPVPPSDQPWYVNGVVRLETDLEPEALLAYLHRVEAGFGRSRRERNEARVIDLDLLAYYDRICQSDDPPSLPHPRMSERAFVLLPLAALAPEWRHPVSGLTAQALAEKLGPDTGVEPID